MTLLCGGQRRLTRRNPPPDGAISPTHLASRYRGRSTAQGEYRWLDVARITQGKIQLQQQLWDIRPLIEAAVASARRLIDNRGHQLSTTLPGRPLWVRGDNVRLEQIVVNLLTNAAKYTDRNGKIALDVDARGGNIYVRVRDNGIGIAAGMLEHIFEPFRQLRAPGRTATDGLGIGLTLARRLVELHGGDIAVSSAGPRKGSEFTVRLPLAQPRIEQPSALPEIDLPSLPAGTRILIIDSGKARWCLARCTPRAPAGRRG